MEGMEKRLAFCDEDVTKVADGTKAGCWSPQTAECPDWPRTDPDRGFDERERPHG